MISGRIVLANRELFVDDNVILGCVDCGTSDDGAFAAVLSHPCDACDGYGNARGSRARCEWCKDGLAESEFVFTEPDESTLRAWVCAMLLMPVSEAMEATATKMQGPLHERKAARAQVAA